MNPSYIQKLTSHEVPRIEWDEEMGKEARGKRDQGKSQH
jgi:hypothetical protein